MKYYLFDEIPHKDMKKIEEFLEKNCTRSGIDRLFWVEVPGNCLSEMQSGHKDCQPYVFPIETGKDWIKAEFFIRTLRDLNCTCSGYCMNNQRDFILDYMDNIIASLNIRV